MPTHPGSTPDHQPLGPADRGACWTGRSQRWRVVASACPAAAITGNAAMPYRPVPMKSLVPSNGMASTTTEYARYPQPNSRQTRRSNSTAISIISAWAVSRAARSGDRHSRVPM